MSDLISRQAAIEAVYEALRTPLPCYGNDLLQDSMTLAKAIVKNIPSAEPERKKGKWVYKPNEYDDSTYECSQCGEPWTLIDGTPEENNMKFCPNCGAKLDWSDDDRGNDSKY